MITPPNGSYYDGGFRVARIDEVVQNLPPVIPYDPYPANNSEEMDTALTLSWSCSDPEGDEILYDLYFGQNDTLVLVATDMATPQYFVDELLFLTSYSWKVIAKDSRGGITEGPLWIFSTRTPEIPTPMPTARSWLAAVSIDNRVMAIGGANRLVTTTYADNEIYDPITNGWEIRTPMPTPRYALAAAEYSGKVYVFGGQQPFGIKRRYLFLLQRLRMHQELKQNTRIQPKSSIAIGVHIAESINHLLGDKSNLRMSPWNVELVDTDTENLSGKLNQRNGFLGKRT